jgi:hypothetical protein
MRLSELCGSEVRDGRDRRIGQVVDVRVVHELASAGEGPRPFRVTGIIVAPPGPSADRTTRPAGAVPFQAA